MNNDYPIHGLTLWLTLPNGFPSFHSVLGPSFDHLFASNGEAIGASHTLQLEPRVGKLVEERKGLAGLASLEKILTSDKTPTP